ncbi:MAG: pectinesterase family protein [Lachnospiraceae bacterium]|nr:pectinesterase family protein [Lachnospiraceae bacterium]
MCKSIYVNDPSKSPCYPTIQQAIDSIPADNAEQVTIYIAPGTYRERLTVQKPFVTLQGAAADTTVIVYGHYALEMHPDGRKRGTFRSYSMLVDTHDFTARDLTIQNDAGCGSVVGQALALYMDGDRCALYNCRLLGSQDTLFTGALPEQEMKAGGFVGPKEFAPRIIGRQYYQNCYIQGDVDFVFGSATAYFENCEFFTKNRYGDTPIDNPREAADRCYGYVTAASTYGKQEYGYILDHCRFTSDCPAETVYLGRPWRQYAQTVLLHCELGAHIKPEGWQDWNKPHETIRYAEFECFGPGAAPERRADFSSQLTEEEAAHFTKERVLGDWPV